MNIFFFFFTRFIIIEKEIANEKHILLVKHDHIWQNETKILVISVQIITLEQL